MSESIIVALISALATVIGVVLTNKNMLQKQADQLDKQLAVHEAVTNQKIDELTREVREHNNFAKRVPVIEEQIKVANHRIEDLEHITRS